MASLDFEQRNLSHVRIWSKTQPVGGGFVVGERLIMTCAHVVLKSLGPNPELDETGRPTGKVFLDSLAVDTPPMRPDPEAMLKAQVVPGKWIVRDRDGGGDIALLKLCDGDELPDTARIAVRSDGPLTGIGFSAYGILAGRDSSGKVFLPKVVDGKLKGPLGGRRAYQVGSDLEETAVREGCSGAAVWKEGEGVVGMIVSWQERMSGVMIPVDVLQELYPIARGGASATAMLASMTGGMTAGVAEILMERLPSFDREPQTARFETAITRTWDQANRPVLCLVGGLPEDVPRACCDTLRSHLGSRFAELPMATSDLKAQKLPWPEEKRFDVGDAFEALKNGIKSALKETRGNDPARLRARYNDQLKGFIFFSEIVQKKFGADHRELLRRWKEYWNALGAEPLNKPLAHLLLFTFSHQPNADVRRAQKSRLSFYQNQFAQGEGGSFERLPMLDPFCARDVDDWIDSFEEDVDLAPAAMRRLRLQIGKRFPAEPSCRLAELEKWILEMGGAE